jgi:hypothetical protein
VAAVEELKARKETLAGLSERYRAALHEAATDTHMSTMEDSAEEGEGGAEGQAAAAGSGAEGRR